MRVRVEVPEPATRSRSRNVNRAVRAVLTVRAMKRALTEAVAAQAQAMATLTGGQKAEATLVLDRRVLLEVARESRDRYGRLLAEVYLADDKTLVQELLVGEGFCRTLVIPPNAGYGKRLRAAKTEAQRAERGIWARAGGSPDR